MADSKKYNGSTWEHSLRKLTTATETVENPLYSDGTAITSYTIKGNTVQNGTPTPDNPVDANGVGMRTENLIDLDDSKTGLVNAVTGEVNTGNTNYLTTNLRVFQAGTYTISLYNPYEQTARNTSTRVCIYTNGVFDECVLNDDERDADYSASFTLAQDKQVRISVRKTDENVMLNTGSKALPYEPYGYKIPISNGQQTTNIYLGSTQTVRQIKKVVLDGTETWMLQSINEHDIANFRTNYDFLTGISSDRSAICSHFYQTTAPVADVTEPCFSISPTSEGLYLKVLSSVASTAEAMKSWLAAQYAAGTPVTVWYVLTTSQTAVVNEPLMKIGDYADTLSNAAQIPTTEGANSITVDTTVQPSEFTATWTGWHNASVKEWDASQWIE